MRNRRIGTFRVSREFFDEGGGANLFFNMIILSATDDWSRNCMVYVAIHPDFEIKGEGEMAAEYSPIFDEGEIYPRWVKV